MLVIKHDTAKRKNLSIKLDWYMYKTVASVVKLCVRLPFEVFMLFGDKSTKSVNAVRVLTLSSEILFKSIFNNDNF